MDSAKECIDFRDFDLSAYSDTVVQCMKHETKRQQIDRVNSPSVAREHCKFCNLYLDGLNMPGFCNKLCCDHLWHDYKYHLKVIGDPPLLLAVYHKQANGMWIVHKSEN